MNYAIEVRCKNEQMKNPPKVPKPEPPSLPDAVKGRMENTADKFEEVLPEQAVFGQLIATSQGEILRSAFNVKRQVVGTKTVQEEEGEYEVEVDNKEDILDEVEEMLADIEAYEVRCHACYHDEQSRRPCGKWKVERSRGEVPQEDL